VQAAGGVTAPLTSTIKAAENLTPLPSTADGKCAVTGNVSLPKGHTTPSANFMAELSYTPATSASPSPSPSQTITTIPVHPVVGFDSKCLDDRGNSSSNRAQVVIWTCSGSDPAENWQFSNNEFIHNGKCLNDQGNAGSGGHVILYTCNGGSNEKWSELANGEIRLQSHSNTLCLDDPRSSTKNGTQLIVFSCKVSTNQKWAQP
jgi:ricin-type beta-trefoil lectin protein